MKEFEIIGPRYSNTSDCLIIIKKGTLLIESNRKNIILYENECYKISATQMYRLSGMTDVEVFIIFEGKFENIIDVAENRSDEEDTYPRQMCFSWQDKNVTNNIL